MFEPATRRRYLQEIEYTSGEYLGLLQTYSGHRALDQTRRRGLLTDIGALIDQGYGGKITKCYLYELRIAPRR